MIDGTVVLSDPVFGDALFGYAISPIYVPLLRYCYRGKFDTPVLKDYQLYHNYLRPREALGGKTPSEALWNND